MRFKILRWTAGKFETLTDFTWLFLQELLQHYTLQQADNGETVEFTYAENWYRIERS